MGYIEQSLGHNETLIYKARFHWLHYALAAIALVLILSITVAISIFVLPVWSPSLVQSVAPWLVCLALLIWLFISMIPVFSTEIGVTNHRLIFKEGWLTRTTDELRLGSIEQVNLRQSFWGQLLGYGQVDVHGTGVDNMYIPPIADPVGFVRAIEDATGNAKNGKASQG